MASSNKPAHFLQPDTRLAFPGLFNGLEMMAVTLLLARIDVVIGGQAIADQDARKLVAQGCAHDIASAPSHLIYRQAFAGEHPQPISRSAHPPTGFVTMHTRPGPQLRHQVLIGRFQLPSQPRQRLGQSVRTEPQLEQLPQHRTGLAHGQSVLLVQLRRHPQGARSQLHPGGSLCQRHLQRMRRTHGLPATRTVGLLGGQFDHARTHHRQLFDILHHLAARPNFPATLRTSCQGHYDFFIHVIGNGASGTGMARGTTGLFGIEGALLVLNAKRCGLTRRFFLQFLDFARQPVIAVTGDPDLLAPVAAWIRLVNSSMALPASTQNDLNQFVRVVPQRFNDWS